MNSHICQFSIFGINNIFITVRYFKYIKQNRGSICIDVLNISAALTTALVFNRKAFWDIWKMVTTK